MIVQVLRLTRWELFKVRKRWMPWILLAVAIVVVQATLWGFYAAYGSVDDPEIIVYHGPLDEDGWSSRTAFSCDDVDDAMIESAMERVPEEELESVLAEIEEQREWCPGGPAGAAERQRHREVFVLPGSLASGLGVAHYIGVFLVMILGASALGSEYGWGTLRTALTGGTRRWQFLGAKALALVLLGVGRFACCIGDRSGQQSDRRFTHAGRRRVALRYQSVVHSGGDVWQGGLRAAAIRHPDSVPHRTDLIVEHGHCPLLLRTTSLNSYSSVYWEAFSTGSTTSPTFCLEPTPPPG